MLHVFTLITWTIDLVWYGPFTPLNIMPSYLIVGYACQSSGIRAQSWKGILTYSEFPP